MVKTLFVAMDDMEIIFDLCIMKKMPKFGLVDVGFLATDIAHVILNDVHTFKSTTHVKQWHSVKLKKYYAKYNVCVIRNFIHLWIHYIQGLVAKSSLSLQYFYKCDSQLNRIPLFYISCILVWLYAFIYVCHLAWCSQNSAY